MSGWAEISDGNYGIISPGLPASELAAGGLLAYYKGFAGEDLYRADVTRIGPTPSVQDSFEGGLSAGWTIVGDRTTATSIGMSARTGSYVMRLVQGDTPQDQVFRYDTTSTAPLYVDFYLRGDLSNAPTGTNNRIQLFIQAFNSGGTPLTGLTALSYVNQEDIPTNRWFRFLLESTPLTGTTFQPPAGTTYLVITIRLQNAVGRTGVIWLDDFALYNTQQTCLVLEDGEVVATPGMLTYNSYINGVLDRSGLTYGGGWVSPPVVTGRSESSLTVTGEVNGVYQVYGIMQATGLPIPTASQVLLGLGGDGNDALGEGQVTSSLGQPFELTLTRVAGNRSPIFDVYVSTFEGGSVTQMAAELLSPPAGKGYVVVAGLPAPAGSMLLQLPVTVVAGDVIEYDLNSRPSSKVVTVLPNGVRSAT